MIRHTTNFQPVALRATDAAAYLGMSRSKFLELVATNVLPQPKRGHGLVLWDRRDLDFAFENEWPIVEEGNNQNTFDKVIENIR